MKKISQQGFAKNIILFSICFLALQCQESMPVSFNSQSAFSQKADTLGLSQAINQCFRESDPAVLMPHMSREVLMMNDYGEEVREQGEVLNDLAVFFKEHLFSSFKIKHHLTTKGGKSEFIVGIYRDKKGKEFRIEISAVNSFIDEIDICLE